MNELIPHLEEVPQWAATVGGIGFFVFLFSSIALLVSFTMGSDISRRKNADERQKSDRNRLVALGVIVAASFVSTIVGSGLSFSAREANQNERDRADQARQEWVESYGVGIKKDTLDELDFPDEEPTQDTEYGIAEVTQEKTIVSVLLVWEDGDFVLYGTDGQPLQELRN